MKTRATLSYCGDLTRRHDPDRFLLALLMPPETREALFALFAFNYEIAKTREVVSDTTLGLIRLQWWRDALGEAFNGAPPGENEILPALAEAIEERALPKQDFEQLIYAREFDLEDMLPETLGGLEKYADFTNTGLNRLALRIIGQSEPEDNLAALSAAYGMTGLLRALPGHARQHRCYLPADLLAARDIDPASLQSPAMQNPVSPDILRPVIRDVAHHARALLTRTKPQSRYGRKMRQMTTLYLRQIEKNDYNPYSGRMQLPPPFFHIRIVMA